MIDQHPLFVLGAALAVFVAAAAFPDPARAEDDGTISGKVVFKGGLEAAPKRTVVKMQGDPWCHKLGHRVGTEKVIVNKDGTLRNVVVYVKKGLGDRKFDPPDQAVVIDQVGCQYKPHVLAMMTGQTLKIKHSDNNGHNIHGLCKKNAEFNISQTKATKPGMERKLTFKKPEAFKVKCDIHGWMAAYVVVLDHPFSDVTGKQGTFTLSNLPAGDYVVEAWHEEYGTMTQKVTVAEGPAPEMEFVFDPKR